MFKIIAAALIGASVGSIITLFFMALLLAAKDSKNNKEVKRGKWFIDDFPKQNKKFLICSECRAVIDCNVNFIDENEYDFCPYCGAKMDLNGGAVNG